MRHVFLLSLLLLAACNEANTAETAPPPEPPPDPQLAYNAGYATPAKYKTECIGRHLIDVPSEMAWALSAEETPYYPGAQFTKQIYAMNDVWFYQRVQVSATPKTGIKTYHAATKDLLLDDRIFVTRLKERIPSNERLVAQLEGELLAGTVPPDRVASYRAAIQGHRDTIKELQESISEFREVDLGLPDSHARTRGDNIIAYLWRDNRVWRFATRKAESESFEQMYAFFIDTLRRFRPRALYEIPTEPGVCVPHGFFKDDGRQWYQLQDSLRLKDAPNVIYTLGIGKNLDEPKATGYDVWATSFMNGGGAAGTILGSQISKNIKPVYVKIGALQGLMGGFVIKPDLSKGDKQEQSYHLQAGYDGEANSDLFPYVSVAMRSFTKGHDPSLTKAAPAFEQSKDRMIDMMKSIRLRLKITQGENK